MAFSITEQPKKPLLEDASVLAVVKETNEKETKPSLEQETAETKPGLEMPTSISAPSAASPLPTSAETRAVSVVAERSKDELDQQIERILSEGLKDLYLALPEGQQGVFRQTGEQAAQTIKMQIESSKITMIGVDSIIRKWLMLLVGVSEFFREQQVRLKTEKIFELSDKKKSVS